MNSIPRAETESNGTLNEAQRMPTLTNEDELHTKLLEHFLALRL